MSAPLPLNEEELFSRASELPVAERAAYLDQACASDPALRARVEALLRARPNGSGGYMLNAPPAVAVDGGATGERQYHVHQPDPFLRPRAPGSTDSIPQIE